MLAQQDIHPSQQSEGPARAGNFLPRQRVWVSRGLVALCQGRLESIARRCNPADLPLANFLKEQIAAEEESAESLKRLDWTLHRDGDAGFSAKEFDALLPRFLPSAFSRSGEGLMDRDTALHFVEVLEGERQNFFAWILEGLSEDLTGILLRAESDRSRDRLRLVRTILLPPPQCVGPVPTHPATDRPHAGAVERRSWTVAVSGHINQLRELHRASPASELWRPVVTELLRELIVASSDAEGVEEPLARRFLREFTALREAGTRNLEDILSVARVALAWLMGGHTRRSLGKSAATRDTKAEPLGFTRMQGLLGGGNRC